jgi:predicted phage terminase large subunit-like protein
MSETDRIKALKMLSALEKRKTQEEAQRSFIKFVEQMWDGFISGPHHKKMADAFERAAKGELKRLIINMPPRHALTLDTLIPTTSGMKSMRDIAVGDEVFHVSGKAIKVLGKSEVFNNRDLYKVTTDDGCEVICDGAHLWTVRIDRKRDIYHTHTTENLWKRQQGWFLRTKRGGGVELKSPEVWEKANYEPVRLPMLPAFGVAQYSEKDLIVDPYVLGLWLGDGTSLQAIITSHDDDAVCIRPEIERRGYKTSDQATYFTFGILGLKAQLREIGVLGNKHIPQIYLEGSEAQRRDLLKGLMDSDGNVSKKGQCFFSQKSKVFIEQVRVLLASLGIKSTIYATEAKIGNVSYGMHYQCSFYASDIAFLHRKEERTLKTKRTFGRYISVEKLNNVGDTQCIKVDSGDGLFLVSEGYVCTHNTKSEFASYLLPAWWLGLYPDAQVMQISHTAELAEGFGRKVRNLVDSDDYHEVFPNTVLSKDSTAAARWNTSKKGIYHAMGVGAAVAGKGCSLLVLDDVISEQEGKTSNPVPHNNVYDYYMTGPRQRLQPGGVIILVMTRWSKIDLTGRLVDNMIKNPDGDQWEVIEFPAILPSGKPLWEAFWSLEDLLRTKATIDSRFWNAQYMQNPTSEEGAIIKREWWRIWGKKNPPPTEFILMSWDTAYEKHNRADYSAMTVWGVFYYEDEETGATQPNIMLLDAVKKRVEFPELKQWVYDAYNEWQPDSMIVEKRASGASLIQELRRMGIPTQEFTPGKGNDKISRLTAVADIFASGFVWCPDTRWAQELMDEVASFPAGQHDDLCLVGNTQILMADGTTRRIDALVGGEYIHTPLGNKRIQLASLTGISPTWVVVTSGGTLEGSAAHRVFTQRGWVRLDELSTHDTIHSVSTTEETSWQQKLPALTEKLLNSMGEPINCIVIEIIMNVLGAGIFYIETCGNTIRELSQKAIKSITLMVTKRTTILPTSKCCLGKLTDKNIKKPTQPLVHALIDLNTWLISELKHQNGINHPKAESGIKPTQKTLSTKKAWLKRGVMLYQKINSVQYVIKHTLLKTCQELNTVLVNVYIKLQGTEKEPNGLQQFVNAVNVVKTTQHLRKQLSIAVQNAAVLKVYPTTRTEKVYNLSISESPVYYANGLLTHNCDTVSMAMMLFRQGGHIRTRLDEPDEEITHRRHKREYY